MNDTAKNLTAYNYCALPLASYACRPDASLGRIFEEPESTFRTCFQRDRDRIIHSTAFRRLKHKTQVFVYHEGDHYRTRLTHTLEVAQIARTLARALYVNEDLAEAVALSHDLGHTPFAHVGEDTLEECMHDVGGYDHNDQSLRVVTVLEHKYPRWRGMNLTWESLEGIVKHNGPIIGPNARKKAKPLSATLKEIQAQTDLRLDSFASVEAQVAALADDIAYNNHDVEDGLTAGLFTLADLERLGLIKQARTRCLERYPEIVDEGLMISGIIREMIGLMVEDVLAESGRRLKALAPTCVDDVRNANHAMVAFSDALLPQVDELRAFLLNRMYRHPHVTGMRDKATKIITDLYELFMKDPSALPSEWKQAAEQAGAPADKIAHARVVADYIAGMTDRFAIREHERLFNVKWDMH